MQKFKKSSWVLAMLLMAALSTGCLAVKTTDSSDEDGSSSESSTIVIKGSGSAN